jgi:hypothetical protein
VPARPVIVTVGAVIALMVNVNELEGEPVGLITETRAVPGDVKRFEGIVACKSVAL